MLRSLTTWDVNNTPDFGRGRSEVLDAPIPSRTEYGFSGSIGTHYEKASSFGAGAFARADLGIGAAPLPAKIETAEKVDVLDATVKQLEGAFLIVTAAPGGDQVEIQIPLILCPDELRMVGTPIAISVDNEAAYSSLKITRREKKKDMSDSFRKRLGAMTEWADSL